MNDTTTPESALTAALLDYADCEAGALAAQVEATPIDVYEDSAGPVSDPLARAREICVRFLEAAALLDGKTLPDLDPDAVLRDRMRRIADTGAVQYAVSIEYDVRESGFYVVASGLDPRRFPETGHLDSEVRIKHLTPSWATLTVRLPGQPISVMLDRLTYLIAAGLVEGGEAA